MERILLRGGRVLDGTGSPERRTDVLVEKERIAALGNLGHVADARILDASGACISPGFIDAHSHSDAYLLLEPRSTSKIFQGITTEVTGQCGASAAPLRGAARLPSDWASHDYPGTWNSFASYLDLLQKVRPAVHVVPFVGHGTLRAGLAGYAGRPLAVAELDVLCSRLEEAFDQGAAGLSLGLAYPPGRSADARELRSLASLAARRDRPIAVHMRDEGCGLLRSLDEVLDMARASGIRLQISHLKTSTPDAWPLLDAAFEKIEQARAEGLYIAADRYPYTAGATDLDAVLPAWATDGPREEQITRLLEPGTARQLARETERLHADKSWDHVMIGATWHPQNRDLRGRRIDEIAAEMKKSPGEAILEILARDRGRTGAFFFDMSPENLRRIYRNPWVMPGSDASTRSPTGCLSEDHPHPRAYGTFPRFLRLALDENLLPLPEAVRRATSLPAEQFGLSGRGILRPGAFADIAIWRPQALRDRADYACPNCLADGIIGLLIDGKVIVPGEASPEARRKPFQGDRSHACH